MQDYRTVQPVIPGNPKKGTVIRPLQGHPPGLRTQLNVRDEGDQMIDRRNSGALGHEPLTTALWTPRPYGHTKPQLNVSGELRLGMKGGAGLGS